MTGDPASCSHSGGALRQLAARLRGTSRGAQAALQRPDGGRPPTPLVHAERRFVTVEEAAAASALELDRVGTALQAYATDLAEAVAALRELIERAEAEGLRLADGQVKPAWGVTGIADGLASVRQEQSRTALQDELDRVTGIVARRRLRLRTLLAGSRDVLATHSAALRR